MLELKKSRLNFSANKEIPPRINGLLREIGYTEDRRGKSGGFWERNNNKDILGYILHDVRELYLAKVKQLHTDVNFGTARAFQRLNDIYGRIEELINNKINPKPKEEPVKIITQEKIKVCECGCRRGFSIVGKSRNQKYFDKNCLLLVRRKNQLKIPKQKKETRLCFCGCQRNTTQKYFSRECAGKSVKCVETGKIYDSIADAAKEINVSRPALIKLLKGDGKTCGGFHWEFVNKELTITA